MKTNATTPNQGEHLIAYAYPSSPRACRLKHGKAGCYVVQTASQETPLATYPDALALAQRLGTAPQRWSMDHPLNARFLNH